MEEKHKEMAWSLVKEELTSQSTPHLENDIERQIKSEFYYIFIYWFEEDAMMCLEVGILFSKVMSFLPWDKINTSHSIRKIDFYSLLFFQ